MSEMVETPVVPLSFVVLTGCTTFVLASALAFVFWKTNKYVSDEFSSLKRYFLFNHIHFLVV
jgi:hypothetical protein